jgi:hypothetical protein
MDWLFVAAPTCPPVNASQEDIRLIYCKNRRLETENIFGADFEDVKGLRLYQRGAWGRGKSGNSLNNC